ncbi:hypothetical protein H2248_007953 [Termitomyces sp. 'cryptogamus']|nr:hypothetical protein H2248_007953 [Termitomyces sp. 'cryptogamus']
MSLNGFPDDRRPSRTRKHLSNVDAALASIHPHWKRNLHALCELTSRRIPAHARDIPHPHLRAHHRARDNPDAARDLHGRAVWRGDTIGRTVYNQAAAKSPRAPSSAAFSPSPSSF